MDQSDDNNNHYNTNIDIASLANARLCKIDKVHPSLRVLRCLSYITFRIIRFKLIDSNYDTTISLLFYC